MKKIRTKEQILSRNGFDFEAFKFENEHSAKDLLLAMDEYSEQNCDQIRNLYAQPAKELNPLKDLYRKENPHPEGKFYLPDTTAFYKWIRVKFIGS
jgi:hypothetical protein